MSRRVIGAVLVSVTALVVLVSGPVTLTSPAHARELDDVDVTRPATISVAFLPRGYTELTAAALATPGGTVPAWGQVPQPLGY